jgi:hypothetical protein
MLSEMVQHRLFCPIPAFAGFFKLGLKQKTIPSLKAENLC